MGILKRANSKQEVFDFRCYDAVQAAADPISAGDVALIVRENAFEVRRVLERLFRQKAISRVRVGGVWRYFV